MYEKSPKIYFFDKVLAKTLLPLFPEKYFKPNHFTIVRFILVPIVTYFFWSSHYWWGLSFFLVAALTDAIDGALARTRDQITEWGRIYDPLADKLLIGSAVFILVLNFVDVYAAMIIIFLEIITVTAALFKKRSGGQIQSNFWGKLKMCLQVLGVVILLLALLFNVETLLPVSQGTFYLAIAFAIMSLVTQGL
jgi:CDP-diacylglycerol--glycerol-3-phosphate 3-phosphatidyltransferase